MRALILAAGFGTRLGDLTREIPKPMLPLAGRPLLEYLIRNLVQQGITEIAINLHFHPEAIRGHFGDGRRFGAQLVYSYERELLGTAGALRPLAAFLQKDGPFLVQYGDVLTDQDIAPMIELHQERQALATLLVHHRPGSNSVLTLDTSDRITGFLERPTEQERQGISSHWVNSGLCVCAPELLDCLPPDDPCDLPRHVFAPLVPTARLFAVPLTGYRCAIDSPQRYREAQQAIAGGRVQIPTPFLRKEAA